MIFLLYRVLQTLSSPAILAWLLLRGLRNRRYLASIPQRLGELPPSWQQTFPAAIWFHAVSVGEIHAAVPLVQSINKRSPETPLFVSTSTLAGRETAEKKLAHLTSGVFFAPLDLVWAVRRVLRRIRPSIVVILETEIWPNLLRESKRLECGLIIINGRISDRALLRYRRFAWFFAPILALCDNILAQSEEMRTRFIEAGAPAGIVQNGGNVKYDAEPAAVAPDSPVLRFITAAANHPLWIAASTSTDGTVNEEEVVLAAQRALCGWRLIIAPRKPERFGEVSRMLSESDLRWTRRSALQDPEADVLLLDSIGELSGLFPFARAVFMGGTLADCGGHNILEPAMAGKPVIVGPHMENFRDIAEHFERLHALRRIGAGDQLRDAVLEVANGGALGERARTAAERERGAASNAADAVMRLYDSRYPCNRHVQPAQTILWLFSLLWKAGSAWDRNRKRRHVRNLPAPVISIGNVTAGGTGKTPVTIELLRAFRECGPGLLIRGHGRQTAENVILMHDMELPISLTGDEARLAQYGARAPVGIGADRYIVGLELIAQAGARVLFLDDGFQHLQLHRDLDLVLIDALHPFGGGSLLPLGRLREPLEGIARADAFLITRSDEPPNIRAIEYMLRQHNPGAPVFFGHVQAKCWRNAAGEVLDPEALRGAPAIAFCGLGNPESFWRTLRRIGIDPLGRYTYGDHHRYTPAELRLLARHAHDMSAAALLTTEKDMVNLDSGHVSIFGDLKLYWLEIETQIDRRTDLDILIRSRLNGGTTHLVR